MGKQWDADITLTNEIVQGLLSTQFPDLTLAEVQWIDTGWDNSVFLVNGSYVFRFPRRRVAVDLIEMENGLLPWLSSQLPLLIPNPVFIGAPTEDYPFPFQGYVKIDGSAPHRRTLSDQQRANSATCLAEFLRTLHSLPVDVAVNKGIAPSDTIGRMDTQKRIPMFISKVEEAHQKGLLQNPDALLAGLDSVPTDGSNGHTTVVHGDLNFRNYLVDSDGRITGVIDWGDAHIGHPAVDLSVVYSYLPPQTRPDFFKVYGEVHPDTLRLAQFRALYTNLLILIYADDIGDAQQVQEAQRSILNAIKS